MANSDRAMVTLSKARDEVALQLRDAGLYNHLTALRALLTEYAGNRFANKNSLIAAKPIIKFPLEAFAVDCGGSNTRIQRYTNDEHNVETYESTPMGSCANDQWMAHNDLSVDKPINQYFGNILEEMLRTVNGDASRVKNVALVWSNNGEPYQLEGETKGVSIKVSGKDAGTDYRKGEPFVEGVKDGDDVGQIFLEEAAKRGIKLDRLIIGNDTIFVGTASSSQPDAAGVASSGSNMEAVIDGFLTNLECGARINAQAAGSRWDPDTDPTIESFIAGNWYPKRYVEILKGYYSEHGAAASRTLALLKEHVFNRLLRKDGSKYFSDLYATTSPIGDAQLASADQIAAINSALNFPADTLLSPQDIVALCKITNVVAERAVALTAVMAAVGLSHRKATADAEGRPLRLAMDSRVLEGLGATESFGKTLNELIGPVQVELIRERKLDDSSSVSVPIQGACQAFYMY